jgi:hypothetical protein
VPRGRPSGPPPLCPVSLVPEEEAGRASLTAVTEFGRLKVAELLLPRAVPWALCAAMHRPVVAGRLWRRASYARRSGRKKPRKQAQGKHKQSLAGDHRDLGHNLGSLENANGAYTAQGKHKQSWAGDHRDLGHNLGSLENANGAYRVQRCRLRRRKLLYHSAKVAVDHPRIKPIPRFHRLDSLQYLRSLRKPGD